MLTFRPWSVHLSGDTWQFAIQVCRCMDGRWSVHGKLLPWFAYKVNNRRQWRKDALEPTETFSRITRIWLPYLFVIYGVNLKDVVYVTERDPDTQSIQ